MPNTDKRNRLRATVIAAVIAALPLAASAAGLGKITVFSPLGQPLKAELEVTASGDELASLSARVASADAFHQAGIEYSPALTTIRFSRDVKERGGRRYLEVSTDRPLNEPFIDMLVELTWASGRLVREYTFLLDPPDLNAKIGPAPVTAPEVIAEPPAPAPAAREPAPVPEKARPLAEPTPPPAQPAEKPAPSSSRTVVAGDTLGKIAAERKPDGVSLDQMLVALFRSNKDAFADGNMNRLKAGKILAIPDVETASQIAPNEARSEVIAQAADFNAYRKRLAAAAAAGPAKDQAGTQEISGKISPKVEDKAPVAKGQDKLEVSRSEAPKDAKGQQLQGRITTLEEDLVARDRALKEASSRIAALERNVSDLKKLAELKSQAGADLQKQAQAAKPAAETKKADVPAVAPAPVVKPPAEPAKPAEAPAAVAPPKPEAATPVEAPPRKAAVPPPPPPEEADFMEENAPLVFGGTAVLALLLGWLGWSAYRKKRAAGMQSKAGIADTDLSTHSVFSTTVAPPPSEQEPSQFSSTGLGMADQETVDPVVEADTFLAFGRDVQAEEILLEALKSDPKRQAIHLKLLDIYAARKNVARFEAVAKELRALTGGLGAGWEKAVALGIVLDPTNPLYQSVVAEAQAPAAAAAAEPDMDATLVLRAPVVPEEPAAPVPAEPAEPTEAVALDFDLDLGTAESPVAAEAVAEPQSAVLDFDLDLGEPQSEPTADAAPQPPAQPESNVLDIDFDMPTEPAPESATLDFPLAEEKPPVEAAPVEAAPLAAASDASSIDFDFDLGIPGAEPVASAAASIDMPETTAAAPAPAALDLSSISLELDMPAPTPDIAAADIPDNPEVVTKIELAMAYEEMGDREGARELFQEALAEGSPAQQKVVRAKLDSLG